MVPKGPTGFRARVDTYEFYAPFAHIPGRLEWCRIRSPTHGVFDTCIILGGSTADPADVYVDSDAGEAFMADRYRECRTVRVGPGRLQILEGQDGRLVTGFLHAQEGPIQEAAMVFRADARTVPDAVPYGGEGAPVWGGRWTCEGVDLNIPASVHGHVQWEDRLERFSGDEGIVTLGSYGRITPL